MREVAIIGGDMIKFGRYPDKTVVDLAAQAVLGALRDAGLTMKEIEILVCGNLYQASGMIGQKVLQEVGQTGIPVVNVANACATGSTAFREAYLAVASGAYDIAMAVGCEQMGKMGLLGTERVAGTEGVIGTGLMPGVFGMTGMEHMRKYGTTIEQFAKVSVKNHKHAVHNPYAQYQKETPLEEVLNSRMISYPNTLYMCCPTGDGAAAAILVPMEKARQYTSQPIKVAAAALATDPWSERDLALPDINSATRKAAREAYQQAGVTPKDLDMVELHDCFATAELLHYENLGLCPEGEAGRFIDEGRTTHGGDVVVNASGGLLSMGHPIGSTGVAKIVEGAKLGLAHTLGLGTAVTVHVLQK
ncbi:MAG: thiolase family protein [Dehalococcoidia bacterium]